MNFSGKILSVAILIFLAKSDIAFLTMSVVDAVPFPGHLHAVFFAAIFVGCVTQSVMVSQLQIAYVDYGKVVFPEPLSLTYHVCSTNPDLVVVQV
jgi:hypothetical protein